MNQTRKRAITKLACTIAGAGIQLAIVCKAEADSFWKLKEADQESEKGFDVEDNISELESIIADLQEAVSKAGQYFEGESKVTKRAREFANRGE